MGGRLEWLRLFRSGASFTHVIYCVKVEMTKGKKTTAKAKAEPPKNILKEIVHELEGKNWGNLANSKGRTMKVSKNAAKKNSINAKRMGKTQKYARREKNASNLRRAGVPEAEIFANVEPKPENEDKQAAINLEKFRRMISAEKKAKKDPKVIEDKYANWLTCLLLKIGDAPESMISDDCKRLLKAAGDIKTKEEAFAYFKQQLTVKKSKKKYDEFIEKLKSQNDEDSQDLLEELQRVEKL